MQITLCEDDSFLHGGVPKNIVVMVTLDDGKKIRFPYAADKSMSSLYSDINENISKIKTVVCLPQSPVEVPPSVVAIPPKALSPSSTGDISKIEREDLVRCVRLEPRGEGATVDIAMGDVVRVLKVLKNVLGGPDGKLRDIINGYEVVNDSHPVKRRIFVFPHEVELVSKRKLQGIEAVKEIEEILDCPVCRDERVSCVLQGSDFHGSCTKDNVKFMISRIIKKCKCGSDASLFHNGDGVYKGVCPKCKLEIVDVDSTYQKT